MIRRDTPGLRWFSVALAFFIMIIPMSEWLAALRPFVLALVMMFWILETPGKMGLGRVLLIGLALGGSAPGRLPHVYNPFVGFASLVRGIVEDVAGEDI